MGKFDEITETKEQSKKKNARWITISGAKGTPLYEALGYLREKHNMDMIKTCTNFVIALAKDKGLKIKSTK